MIEHHFTERAKDPEPEVKVENKKKMRVSENTQQVNELFSYKRKNKRIPWMI